VIQPLLTPRAVQAYVPDVKAATGQLIAAWRAAARAGETMDAQSWVSALARDLTVRALFGAEAGGPDGAMTTLEPAAWRPKYRAFFALLRE
jgi:cytochrome P450